MADETTNDDLLISISTDVATLRRNVKRMEQIFDSTFSAIEKSTSRTGQKIDAAFGDATSKVQRRVESMFGLGQKSTKEWTGALADQGKELERLRSRYSPLFNTINIYKQTLADIRRAHSVGAISSDEMTAAMARERRAALDSIAAIKGRNQAIKASVTTSGGVGNASGFQTANIAAQFQDIAVTAAMGMNPIQIALQQGTQLSSVLMTMGNGKQVIQGLAAAFAAVVSPVSLVTIGLIAGGVALAQYLASGNKTKDLTKTFQQHADSIAAIKAQYGDSANFIQQFRPEDRASQIRALKEQREELFSVIGDQAKKTASFGSGLLTDLAPSFKGAPAAAREMRDAFASLNSSIREGRPDLLAFREAMAKIANNPSVPKAIRENAEWIRKMDDDSVKAARAIPGLTSALNLLGDSAGNNAARLKLLNDRLKEYAEAMQGLKGWAEPELNDEDQLLKAYQRARTAASDLIETRAADKLYQDGMNRLNGRFIVNGDGNRTQVPVPGQRPLYEIEGLPGEAKKAETAQEKLAKAYKNILTDAKDRNEQLRQEIELVGLAGNATDAARYKLELLQKAQKAGLSGDNLESIRKQAAAYEELSASLAKIRLYQDIANQARHNSLSGEDQQVSSRLRQFGLNDNLNTPEAKAVRDQLKQDAWREDIKGFFGDFRGALVNEGESVGKAVARSFSNALLRQADRMWDPIVNQFANFLLGTSSAGGSGAGVAGIGAAATAAISSVAKQSADTVAKVASATASATSGTGSPLSFVGNYKSGVDARLTDILQTAAQRFPGYKVDAMSGFRPGDKRFHGKGLATDVQLTDLANGKLLGNYQDASSFRAYEKFAQQARLVQMEKYPELADKFRWGGYFGGGKGKYGALDSMHFDLAGAGMAGGSWQNGLTQNQLGLWPGATSQGMNAAAEAIDKLTTSSVDASKGLNGIGQALGSATSGAGAIAGAGSQGGGGILDLLGQIASSIGGLLGSVGKGFLSFLGLAEGGHVSGPGTSTSDSIPTMLSNGEFVVRASQTRKHRSVLEAINNGSFLHRAEGGIVAPRMVSAPLAPRLMAANANHSNDNRNPGVLEVHINGASGDQHVMNLAKQAVNQGLAQYNVNQQRGGFGTVQAQFTSRKAT